jgi:hypothetical protein
MRPAVPRSADRLVRILSGRRSGPGNVTDRRANPGQSRSRRQRHTRHLVGGKEADAEQGAGQVELPLEKVGPPLVAHPEATIPEQPC